MGNQDIIICSPPLVMDMYDFLFNHLDCNSIVDRSEEGATKKIKILAYATSKKGNRALKKYFYDKKYQDNYNILIGIDSKEVNSIDDSEIS